MPGADRYRRARAWRCNTRHFNPDLEPHYSTNVRWCCVRCNTEKQRITPALWGARLSMWRLWRRNQVLLQGTPEVLGSFHSETMKTLPPRCYMSRRTAGQADGFNWPGRCSSPPCHSGRWNREQVPGPRSLAVHRGTRVTTGHAAPFSEPEHGPGGTQLLILRQNSN